MQIFFEQLLTGTIFVNFSFKVPDYRTITLFQRPNTCFLSIELYNTAIYFVSSDVRRAAVRICFFFFKVTWCDGGALLG